MKYLKLKNSFFWSLIFLVNIACGQDNDASSNLQNFVGIWQFMPPERSNDTSFLAFELFNQSKRLTLFYRKKSKTIHALGPNLTGFDPEVKKISRLSDLSNSGSHMYFYSPNPIAPNDSIKYFQQASPSCVALFNGIAGEGELVPPENGKPNYFTLNFNGRDNEYYQQIHHLPYKIVVALCHNLVDKTKVEAFLNIKYGIIKDKSTIHKNLDTPTKMYLLKNDPVEIIEEKDNWLKIKYYPEKNGEWTGKTIEGWIKKSDVE